MNDHGISTVSHPWALALGDFDEDGTPDVAVGDSGHDAQAVDILIGNGNGGFASAGLLTAGKFPIAIVAAHLDGDAHLDLAVAANVLYGLTIFHGNGDGTFGPPQHVTGLESTPATDLAAGDVDGDLDLDLALSHYNGVRILLNDGTGAFTLGGGAGSSVLTEAVDVGDVDGDGILDVVSTLLYSDAVVISRGTGNGTFVFDQSLSTGGFPRDVEVVDPNQDGRADIVVVCESTSRMQVFLGSGGGAFLPVQDVVTGLQPRALAVGDLDEDGRPDAAVAYRNLGEVSYAAVHLQTGAPGTGFCFGVACPCGNDSPDTGCSNSTSEGALLSGSGTTSVAAADLLLFATGCPPNNTGLLFIGSSTFPAVLVGDGLACTGGLFRFFPSVVDATGVFTQAGLVANAPPGMIQAGDTRHFQAWTRDVLCGPPPAPCPSPCGNNSNLSSGYTVIFTP